MDDLFGKALLDFHRGNDTHDLITETNISEEDELPLSYLFRSYDEMPALEQFALKQCEGSVMDIGCGAGGHSLWLQENGHQVTAIDRSSGAIEVAKARGVIDARVGSLLEMRTEPYDTLLLLMNGTGIFETVARAPRYLQHLKRMLRPQGQVLIDSSDLQFMYDRNEDGSIWVPADGYYGELQFVMKYKGETTTPFPWLYLDARLFEQLVNEEGFLFEIIAQGEHYDYLARLTLA